MAVDAYEAHPQLLARWGSGEDLRKAIIASFECGECRQILEKLNKGEVSVDDAVAQISRIMYRIHKEVH